MKTNIYAIKDLNADYFMQPMFMRTDAEAKRTFEIAIKNPDSFLYQFPNQFDLWNIGSYDDATGKILNDKIKWLCNGNDFARKDDNV